MTSSRQCFGIFKRANINSVARTSPPMDNSVQNDDPDATIRDHVYFDPHQSALSASKSVLASSADLDWQQLPELPTAAEILSHDATTNDLPHFPIDGKFESKAQYLQSLYRILRFEGVECLRYSVNQYRWDTAMSDDQDTCVYTRVHVRAYIISSFGPVCQITFSTRRAGRKINWKQSNRLLPGRIVALSNDHFQTDCRVAVIAQRPVEGYLDQTPLSVDIFWADVDQAVIDPAQEMVMIDSRNGYYEASRNVLVGLQHTALHTSVLDKYLVSLDTGDASSASIAAAPIFDLRSLLQQPPDDQLDTKRDIQGGLEDLIPHITLDTSQFRGLKRIVSKELAIVQGPPGTGKTSTSVKAVKVELDNWRVGDPPIIIAAQTNHAVDQLLIRCHAVGASVMRLGSRTENEEISKRTAHELRNSIAKTPPDGQRKHLECSLRALVERLMALTTGSFDKLHLITPQVFFEAGIIGKAQLDSLSNEDWEGSESIPPIDMWLGEEKIRCIQQQDDDINFEETEDADEELEVDIGLAEAEPKFRNDDRFIYGTRIDLTTDYTGCTPQISNWEAKCRAEIDRCDDLYEVKTALRGGVYQILQSRCREAIAGPFRAVLKDAVRLAKDFKAHRWSRDVQLVRKLGINVVGCTTTGLSKYRGLIAATSPRILLIEEAAETREANITSALYPTLQQLALIGDHQQLPPTCDVTRLGDAPFFLNTSLFERMVKNNMPYEMLNQQRRMAPEISFIVQKLYPRLLNHPVVESLADRPLIPGMGDRRSWFFTHEWPEETDNNNSKFNKQEAHMVIAFMKHLIFNGMQASDITVLTYYRGQGRVILQLLRKEPLLLGTRKFHVHTVDSYQGEENEVVLLSLVRSHQAPGTPRIGFLESLNRATVAISRARRGFFIFGNIDTLKRAGETSSLVWEPIWNGFASQERVAENQGLPIVCQNHENEVWMKSADDFVGNAGGCKMRCLETLHCGHRCELTCHVIPHEKIECLQPCKKILDCSHECAGTCTEKCRCCQDCHEYDLFRGQKLLGGKPAEDSAHSTSSSKRASNRIAAGRSNPQEWRQFSCRPCVHDDAIRQARIQQVSNTVRDADTGVLIDLDTPENNAGSTGKVGVVGKVQERFTPVSRERGRRVLGAPQKFEHGPDQGLATENVSGGAVSWFW